MDPFFLSSVLWTAGIFGFFGFLIGSVPPNDANGGWSWDMQGALMWMIAAAATAAGVTVCIKTGTWTPGLYAAGAGVAFAALRIATTRPPRVPIDKDLADGIHRATGENAKAKFKSAQRLYRNASFSKGNYYATRSPRDFRYGAKGASAADLSLLQQGLSYAHNNTFAILVLLVRELPNEPGQAAVIVVRSDLGSVKVESDGITIAGSPKIPASTIAGMVGYAWR